MSTPPVPPKGDGIEDPDPMHTDMTGFVSIDEIIDSATPADIDGTMLEGSDPANLEGFVDDPTNIEQMFADFTDAFNAEMTESNREEFDPANLQQILVDFTNAINAEMDDTIATMMSLLPPPLQMLTSEEALEALMLQTQLVVGIPPGELQPLQPESGPHQSERITLYQFINRQDAIPAIPPAGFHGSLGLPPDPAALAALYSAEDLGNDIQPDSDPHGSATYSPSSYDSNSDASNSDASESEGSGGLPRVVDPILIIPDMGGDGNTRGDGNAGGDRTQ